MTYLMVERQEQRTGIEGYDGRARQAIITPLQPMPEPATLLLLLLGRGLAGAGVLGRRRHADRSLPV